MGSENYDGSWLDYRLGEYPPGEFEALPEGYRNDVARLDAASASRKGAPGNDEALAVLDRAGMEENDLRLPPLISALINRITAEIENGVAARFLQAHGVLAPLVRQRLKEVGMEDIGGNRVEIEELTIVIVNHVSQSISLAIHELLINSVKHGNTGDVRKIARLRLRYTDTGEAGGAEGQVSDEGYGIPPKLPDPTAELSSLHGRGILLGVSFLDELSYEAWGTVVSFRVDFLKRFKKTLADYNAEKIRNIFPTPQAAVLQQSRSADETPLIAAEDDSVEDKPVGSEVVPSVQAVEMGR